MDIKVCDQCGEMVNPATSKRVPLIEDTPDGKEAWQDLCQDCLKQYGEYRRAAEEIITRHEREEKEELGRLKEAYLNAAKNQTRARRLA